MNSDDDHHEGAAGNSGADDLVLPFRVEHTDASGRLVRLGAGIDEILNRHAYPEAVSRVLGEALLLAAMLGSTIKERQRAQSDPGVPDAGASERFILQTQSDGVINLLIADYRPSGLLRGYARFDARQIAALPEDERTDSGLLLGKGHLAMTIDRGGDTDRYQGIVALEGDGLTAAANRYFEQSEQLPTSIRLAVGQQYSSGASGGGSWHWRGGGLLVQKLTPVGGYRSAEHGPVDTGDEDGWNRARVLSDSIRDHELIDPLLSAEALLLRLFHEDGVRVFPASPVKAACSCSQDRVALMLAGFSANERAGMAEANGRIHITCEFCNRSYSVDPASAEA